MSCSLLDDRDETLFNKYIQINHMIDTYDHLLNGDITESELGLTNKQFLCVIQGVLRPRYEEMQKQIVPRYKSLSLEGKLDIASECSKKCSCTIFNTIEALPGLPPPEDNPSECVKSAKNSWRQIPKDIQSEITEYCLKSS